MMKTRMIMIVMGVMLLALGGYVAYQEYNRPKTPAEKLEAAMGQAGDAVGEAMEKAGQSIQDAVSTPSE